MDDLYRSDLKKWDLGQRGLWHCIFCSTGHQLGFLLEEIIVSSEGFGCANFKTGKSCMSHLRNFIAFTRRSNTLKELDNISPDHSYPFPMKINW